MRARSSLFLSVVFAGALVLVGCAAFQEGRLRLASPQGLAARIRSASSVTLTAYMLDQYSPITQSLRANARRSTVLLDGYSFGAARRDARRTAAILRHAGATVLWSRSYWHLKAAIVGGALYLDTENFGRAGLLVRDRSSADLALIRQALHGSLGCDVTLCTGKALALEQEAAVIASGRGPLLVQTESFGGVTPVLQAMIARARRGDRVTLAINAREAHGRASRNALALARNAHIRIVGVQGTDKMAVQTGASWFGSANLTNVLGRQADLGVTTHSKSIISALRQSFGR